MFSNDSTKQLAKQIFNKSDLQNKLAVNTVKLIIGDIVTLYDEFRKAEGLGAMFFNPACPENSSYMTVADIRTDIVLAEEVMDDELKDFLKKLLNVIDKEQDSNKTVVVLVTNKTMSVHLIDLDTVEEQIKELSDAFSCD